MTLSLIIFVLTFIVLCVSSDAYIAALAHASQY